ncbi:MAG: hypothetical protein ACYSUT_09035 [Planctomycetota bacterium]|jgi:hypothetical protein
MAWLFVAEVLSLALSVLFIISKKAKLAFFAIGVTLLLPSGFIGVQIAGKTAIHLVPYAVFGPEEARANDITCVGLEEGFYIFSNGERVQNPKSLFLNVCTSLSFIIGAGTVFLPGLFLAKLVTRKLAPEVHELFEPK